MKKILLKQEFPNFDATVISPKSLAEYDLLLETYRTKYYELLGTSTELEDNYKNKIIENIIHNLISNRSTIGTEEIEGTANVEKLIKDSKSDLSSFERSDKTSTSLIKIVLSIFKTYMDYKLPDYFNMNSLLNLHRQIFYVGGIGYRSGKLRNKEVQIPNAEKLFIKYKDVDQHLYPLFEYINKQPEINTLFFNAAFIHGYLVGVHPFNDGNGRTTRLIVDKYISKWLKIPLYISEAINKESKTKYHQALNTFHFNGDLYPLVNFTLDSMISQLKLNIELVEDITFKYKVYTKQLENIGLAKKYIVNITAILIIEDPIINSVLAKKLNITQLTSKKILNLLEENKIIKYSKKVGRNNIYSLIK